MNPFHPGTYWYHLQTATIDFTPGEQPQPATCHDAQKGVPGMRRNTAPLINILCWLKPLRDELFINCTHLKISKQQHDPFYKRVSHTRISQTSLYGSVQSYQSTFQSQYRLLLSVLLANTELALKKPGILHNSTGMAFTFTESKQL